MCGQIGLGDLAARVQHKPAPPLQSLLDLPAYLCAAFELSLQADGLVRFPFTTAGAINDLLAHGVASLLRSKGVIGADAGTRAQSVIQTIGAGRVQAAMSSKQPWKELKSLANQAIPPLQLVFPSELEAAVAQKVAAGEAVGRTRKERRANPKSRPAPRADMPEDTVLLPEQVAIPAGVFIADSGPLQQIRLEDVCPTSAGVVVLTAAQAARYMSIPRPLSSEALGFIALGEVADDSSTITTERVKFHAVCPSSGEPLLLTGLLLQVGDRFVYKHKPAVANLDVVKSVVQRAAVYREEWEGDWLAFAESPLRSIVSVVPLLRTCEVECCECSSWHGISAPGKPEAILEAYGRTFTTEAFRACQPAVAKVFSIFIRVPLALEEPLQAFSRSRGVYLEPRGLTHREPSSTFRVIWVPKAARADVLLLRQTHPQVTGLARVGNRYGVRCLATDEAGLHAELRPASPFLCKDSLRTYSVGPFPHGTRREALQKLFTEIRWSARPRHKCRHLVENTGQ